MKVSEIQAGRPVSGTFLASQVEKRSARSGKDYLWTVLKDTSGDSIVGLLFDAPPSTFDAVESGTTVEVKGEADEFRGSTNVKIRSIHPASEQWDATDLLPRSERSEADMLASLSQFVQRIENTHVRAVTERVLSDPAVKARLGNWPAAMRRHHAHIGGLLEHILEVLTIAETVGNLYPQIDMDLVYAGCIVHDIGKVVELGMAADIDYTPAGVMVGHVTLGDELVSRACDQTGCPAETALKLRNIVLSHHGMLEWGSPVLPKTAEAVAVHHIDQVSSQLRQAVDAVAKSKARTSGDPVGQWDRSWGRNWFVGTQSGDTDGDGVPPKG